MNRAQQTRIWHAGNGGIHVPESYFTLFSDVFREKTDDMRVGVIEIIISHYSFSHFRKKADFYFLHGIYTLFLYSILYLYGRHGTNTRSERYQCPDSKILTPYFEASISCK